MKPTDKAPNVHAHGGAIKPAKAGRVEVCHEVEEEVVDPETGETEMISVFKTQKVSAKAAEKLTTSGKTTTDGNPRFTMGACAPAI